MIRTFYPQLTPRLHNPHSHFILYFVLIFSLSRSSLKIGIYFSDMINFFLFHLASFFLILWFRTVLFSYSLSFSFIASFSFRFELFFFSNIFPSQTERKELMIFIGSHLCCFFFIFNQIFHHFPHHIHTLLSWIVFIVLGHTKFPTFFFEENDFHV